ncbi:protein MAIN-LIKE 2-like [Arachis ipaensis]|uniref:Aminotransferase-like plant mobile domain-containing protein n=1 Tax=Arachis hypogaea TaxID=3818 RepID=A0A445AYQ4_ARAHY|nr:protein MAIN-LIKE 2-like [Arachis ipaensis]XP_025628657.1 protein MAIN-LIKE 2-like [Arachis hypogaea]RYR31559.1 hypothetical protein Ahy_B01g056371 [Arachis hypogaea]
MPLHDRIIPYLERAGLYHLVRLNARWFWLDESLVSAFIERWRPETHTFHMPFGECTITLQDVAYQLGLPVDGLLVSGCLTDFEKLMEEGKPAWEWVLSNDATEDTVCKYARAYIMMLLSRWATYLPTSDRKERVIQCRLLLDRLGDRDFVWEPYASLDVMAVVHPEIPIEEHSRLWRACTCLIYFAVIEWHQVDRVLPQLGGVQHESDPASNIDWLHAKDGRDGDRWPSAEFLRWWYRVAHRFLSPDSLIAYPRPEKISQDVVQRGSSQAPSRFLMPDVPDNRRVERRRRLGTRAIDWKWRWLDEMIQDDIASGDGVGHVDHRVRRGRPQRRGGASGVASGGPGDRPTEQAGTGSQEVPFTHVLSS